MTSPPSILERIAGGDPSAVTACMERFGGLVRSLARRTCPNATEVDEAVQEIFVDIWRCAARFDASVASETTFVATIARRRLIDRMRRRSREPRVTMVQELPPDADRTNPAVRDRSEIREEGERAMEALNRLRPEQEQVLRLAIHCGQTHEEIATTTGMPLGTVKTHARRGLIKLRALLEAREAEQEASLHFESNPEWMASGGSTAGRTRSRR